MSQHVYETKHQGQAVSVLMGWDRPMQNYFLMVEAADIEDPVYASLDQANAFGLTLEDFRKVLQGLGIAVPESMFEQVAIDAKANMGNRFATHQANGSFIG